MKSGDEPSTTSSRRRYDSSRRQADALARQQRVLVAASELFLEHGYGSTSIDQIAAAAGVSSQTIYATFESKAGILERAVHLARTGDAAGSVSGSAEGAAVLEQPDLQGRCRAIAALLRKVYDRSAALTAIVEQASATDPALAELHERFRVQRRSAVEALSADVRAKDFRKGRTRDEAIDTMTFLAAAHTYTELVDGMGWTPDRYEAWLADALYRLVFAADR
jgi:AcrR family transcriptional regulator